MSGVPGTRAEGDGARAGGAARVAEGLAALGAALLAAALLTGAARRDAITYDEPYHLANAWSLVHRGRTIGGDEHAPLTRWLAMATLAGTPLPALPPEETRTSLYWAYAVGIGMIFDGEVPPGEVLLRARASTVALGALLVLACWWAGRRRHGRLAGLAAALLAALEPSLLAHGHLATTDLAPALFVLLAVEAARDLGQGRRGPILVTGLAAAAALASKPSALVIAPIVLVQGLLAGGGRAAVLARARDAGQAAALAVAGTVLLFRLDPGAVWAAYGNALGRATASTGGYLAGEYRPGGHWAYFVVALALKSSPALLALAALRAGWDVARLARGEDRRALGELAGPLIVLLLTSAARLNIGIRHLLPIYPLLAVYAAGAVPRLVEAARGLRGGRARALAPVVASVPALLLAWHALVCARAAPDHLRWFNGLAGGPSGGWRWLADSNLDWGQEMGTLGAELRARGVRGVYLAPHFNGRPEAYGVAFQRLHGMGITDEGQHEFVPGERRLLVVSVNLLVGITPRPDLYAPLRERAPAFVVSDVYHCFDVDDAEGLLVVAEALVAHGRPDRAREPLARAEALGARPRAELRRAVLGAGRP